MGCGGLGAAEGGSAGGPEGGVGEEGQRAAAGQSIGRGPPPWREGGIKAGCREVVVGGDKANAKEAKLSPAPQGTGGGRAGRPQVVGAGVS